MDKNDLRRGLLLAVLLLAAASLNGAALAQGIKPSLQAVSEQPQVTAAIRRLLAQLPADFLLTPARRGSFAFGDFSAARAAIPERADGRGVAGTRAAPNGRLSQVFLHGAVMTQRRAGLVTDELEQVLTYDTPLNNTTLIAMSEQGMQALAGGLPPKGYALETRDGITAWTSDGLTIAYLPNPEDRSPYNDAAPYWEDDPFRGSLQQASYLQQGQGFLRHASTWPAFRVLTGVDTIGADQSPLLSALLSALDTIEGGPLIGATIYPSGSDLPQPNPVDTVLRGMPASPFAPDGAGIWQAYILADFARGTEWTAVLGLATLGLDFDAQQALEARVRANWAQISDAGGFQFLEETWHGQLSDVSVIAGDEGFQVLRIVLNGQSQPLPHSTPLNHGHQFFIETLLLSAADYLQ